MMSTPGTRPASAPVRNNVTAVGIDAVTAARLPGIDGLRAMAVALVMAFHLTPGAVVGGFIGVDVFFVISGFLITGLLLREKSSTGTISLRGFWMRRARRLLPALALLLLVCSSAAFVIGGDLAVGIRRQLLGATTFSYNWLAVAQGSSYFEATTPELFRNLWSLAVEEQFYLLWPLLVLLLVLMPGRTLRVALVALLTVASAATMVLLSLSGADPTRIYYGTDSHALGLAVGAVLAILAQGWHRPAREWRRRTRTAVQILGTLALLGIVAIAVLMPADAPIVFTGGLALVALLSAAAIAGAIVPGGVFGGALDTPPLRWIGERSYGLYLWHWPVYLLVVGSLPGWERSGASGWGIAAISLVITVVAAALSYRFVEVPFRRGGVLARIRVSLAGPSLRTPPRRLAEFGVAGIAGVAMLAALSLTVVAAVSDTGRGQAQARIEAGQEAVAHPSGQPRDATAAAPAALPTGDQISAIGDSVMLAAAPQLNEGFPGIGIDAVVSRQMMQAPEIVRGMVEAGTMRPILLIGLGTNGPIGIDTLQKVQAIVGPKTRIVLVNVQAPRGWTPGVNSILGTFAQQQREVELANWQGGIRERLDVLAPDQIHPGGPTSGGIYVDAIKDALQRLAELPPILNSNDYGLSPHPA